MRPLPGDESGMSTTSLPNASRISRTRSAGTSMPRIRFDLRETQHDRLARRRRAADVDHAGRQFAAGQFEDQLAAAAAGPIEPLGIDPPLEAIRRIAVQIQLPGRVADRDRIELGRLDQHVAGGGRNLRLRPAHHPADRHRLAGRRRSCTSRARARRSCGRWPRSSRPAAGGGR